MVENKLENWSLHKIGLRLCQTTYLVPWDLTNKTSLSMFGKEVRWQR